MKTRGGHKHMTNIKKRVIIIKDVFRGENKIEDFDEYHMIVYAGMQLFYNPALEEINMNLNMLYDRANITDKRAKQKIRKSLNDIIEWGLISFKSKGSISSNTHFRAEIPNITSRYTMINADFVLQILGSDNQIGFKGNMLRLYSLLAQYTGNKLFAYPNIDTLAADLNVSTKTINNAMSHLESMDILLRETIQIQNKQNGLFNNTKNVYVFCDTENSGKVMSFSIDQMKKRQL